MADNTLDIRVYPIDEPQGNTLAFASVAIDDLAAIRGVRVVNGENGLFVTMPQSQDNSGLYHDVAFPLTAELRKKINTDVLQEFVNQQNLEPADRGYVKLETDPDAAINVSDVKIGVKVFPIAEPRGNTLAFASVGLDDAMAIRGIRVVDSERGMFVSMPQSKDKEGKFHDVAFPLSGDLRKAVSNAILSDYKEQTAERSERKQSIKVRLAEGAEKAAEYAASAPARSAAKKAPGLGE